MPVNSQPEMVWVYVTTRDVAQAQAMGRAMVEARLAACANVLGAIGSVYRWEGQVVEETEAALVLKTRATGFEALRAAIVARHDYACPCVIALPVVAGHGPYLAWLAENTAE